MKLRDVFKEEILEVVLTDKKSAENILGSERIKYDDDIKGVFLTISRDGVPLESFLKHLAYGANYGGFKPIYSQIDFYEKGNEYVYKDDDGNKVFTAKVSPDKIFVKIMRDDWTVIEHNIRIFRKKIETTQQKDGKRVWLKK